MRIDSGTIGMESARSYHTSNSTVRRFTIMEYQGALTSSNNELYAAVTDGQEETDNMPKQGSEANTTGTEDGKITLYEAWKNRYATTVQRPDAVNSSDREISSNMENIRQVTIRYIFDMLFAARRNRLSDWLSEQGISGESSYAGTSNSVVNAENSISLAESGEQALFLGDAIPTTYRVLNYTEENVYTESENTSFSTVGTVRTADGREIKFNVEVAMSREFQQCYREDLEVASFTMCDPLVINLEGNIASLDDQKFFFDIDADGEKDEISTLGSGSGYLALDKNGDGTVNDGSELFGTASGNGFADLAECDEDGNGWIDEADAVWDKLQIWCRDETGENKLYTLREKGLGAICLQNVSTDFTLQGGMGQTNGAIRNTGIFLYENGNVGTVQHVDVAKYSMEA